jgi:hypothetical protein
MSDQPVSQAFLAVAETTLAEGFHKIEHCVGQLSDQQVWWRPHVLPPAPAKHASSEMNSIANLILHLSGNLRQWIIAGVGGSKDVRNRPLEFSDRSQRAVAELLAQLQLTITESRAVLARLTGAQLAEPRRIQGFNTNVTAALFNTISHFRGHVQEIIHLTREQLGDQYRFDFVPTGPEQESAGTAS